MSCNCDTCVFVIGGGDPWGSLGDELEINSACSNCFQPIDVVVKGPGLIKVGARHIPCLVTMCHPCCFSGIVLQKDD